MIDEEMAEKYVKGLCKTCKVDVCRYSKIQTCVTKESLKQAYLAGLKAARQTMWHDLRENPDDLPEDCVINQDGKRVLYDHINKVWRNDDADEYICDDPIAWCDIPTFEA